MWRVILIAGWLWLGSCGGSDGAARDADATPETGSDTSDGADLPVDGTSGLARACLDTPGTLARPPGDTLPCDLFPPDR